MIFRGVFNAVGHRRARMTLILVLINVVIYAIQSQLRPATLYWVEMQFGLSLAGLEAGKFWQFFTHAFLQGSWLHLLFNMIGLWFGGRLVERTIGGGRLLLLYLFGAVSGGLLQMAFSSSDSVLLGASGAVFAIILAFTTMFPDAELYVLLFFVIPLRLKAKYLGWGLVLSSVVFIALQFQMWIGHAAHLGGALGGWLFARLSGYAEPSRLERWILRLGGQR